MRRRKTQPHSNGTLAAGYQSIPALKEPKTEAEMCAIVRDERAERQRTRIAQDDTADDVARTRSTLQPQDA